MKRIIFVVAALFVLVMAPLVVKFVVSTRTSAHASGGGGGFSGCQDSVTVLSDDSSNSSYQFCTSGANFTFIPYATTVTAGPTWTVQVVASGAVYTICPGQSLDLAGQFSPFPPPTVLEVTLIPFNPGDTCTSSVVSGNGGSNNNNTSTTTTSGG